MHTRLQTIARTLDSLAEITGRLVAWLTLGMVIITFAV
ncbi:MAG: C4-dicarboxylate ABC transporter permease, partial [Gammaproteobacteria bacterium]|nr:C4-dicarboxylate ABC transporter permease [Gammaproteobacteria bacterium]